MPAARSAERRLAGRAILLLAALGLCAACLLTWFAVQRFERILLPELAEKSAVVGASVQASIDGALALGIPFRSLVGMDDFLDDTLRENPEIASIAVALGNEGLYRRERARQDGGAVVLRTVSPVAGANAGVTVTVGVRAAYLNEKLAVLFGDTLIMLFLALVAGLEIALFFAYRWLARPLDVWREMIAGLGDATVRRDLLAPVPGPFAGLLALTNERIRRLHRHAGHRLEQAAEDWIRPAAGDVRIALFLFVLTEELLRSFFPLYVREFAGNAGRLGMELTVSAPLMAYLFFAGAGTLFGGGLVDRLGIRRAFGLAVLCTALSLCGMAIAGTLAEIILWRALMAVGYALATVSCQVFIARTGMPGGAARGMAVFVAAVTAACVCGAPVGALLADVFGREAALLCAAGMAVLSWLAFRSVRLPPERSAAAASGQAVAFGRLLRHPRVMLLMVCAVMPSKMLLAGMLFYITPLLLQQAGLPQASIGQFFMLFYLLLLAGNALGGRAAAPGKGMRRGLLLFAGGLLSGAGALLLFWISSPAALAAAIVCFGLGQSMMLAPVSGALMETVASGLPDMQPSAPVAFMRVCERVGGIVGALSAALLSASLGYAAAAATLGAVAVVLALGLAPGLLARTGSESVNVAPEDDAAQGSLA